MTTGKAQRAHENEWVNARVVPGVSPSLGGHPQVAQANDLEIEPLKEVFILKRVGNEIKLSFATSDDALEFMKHLKLLYDVETNPGPQDKKKRRACKIAARRAIKRNKQVQVLKSSLVETGVSYVKMAKVCPFLDEPEVVFKELLVGVEAKRSVMSELRSLGSMTEFKNRLSVLGKSERRRLNHKNWKREHPCYKCKCPKAHLSSCDNNFLVGVELNPGPVFYKRGLLLKCNDKIRLLRERSSLRTLRLMAFVLKRQLQKREVPVEIIRIPVPEFSEFFTEMNCTVDTPAIDRLSDLVRDGISVNHNINLFGVSSKSLSGLVPPAGDAASSIIDFMKEHKAIGLAIGSAIVACFAYNGVQSKILKTIIVVAESLLITYCLEPYVSEWVRRLLEFAGKWMKHYEKEEVEGEELFDMTSWKTEANGINIPFIGTCISGCVLAMSMGQAIAFSKASVFFKSLCDFDRMSKGITSLIDFLIELMRKLGAWILGEEKISGFAIFQDKFPAMKEMEKEVYDFIETMRVGADFNWAYGQKCYDLSKRLNELMVSIPPQGELAVYRRECFLLQQQLKPLLTAFNSENMSGGQRQKPVGVLLSSDSGLGKSTVMSRIIADVAAETMDDESFKNFCANPADAMWAFCYENDFADAYHGQFATTIDEAGLVREVPGTMTDGFMSAIRMINVFDYPLHMAELSKKGNTSFKSKIVIATTNRQNMGTINSIYYPKAYANRFPVAVHVYCAPRFAVDARVAPWERRVDWSLVPLKDGEPLSLEHLIFQPYDVLTGVDVGSAMLYEELIKSIVQHMKTNETFTKTLVKSYAADLKFAIARRAIAGGKTPTTPLELVVAQDIDTFEDRMEWQKLTAIAFASFSKASDPYRVAGYSRDELYKRFVVQRDLLYKLKMRGMNYPKLENGYPPQTTMSVLNVDGTTQLYQGWHQRYLAERAELENKEFLACQKDYDKVVSSVNSKSSSTVTDLLAEEDSGDEIAPHSDTEFYAEGFFNGPIESVKSYLSEFVKSTVASEVREVADRMEGRVHEAFDPLEFICKVNALPKDFTEKFCYVYGLNLEVFSDWANRSDFVVDSDKDKIHQIISKFYQDLVLPKANVFVKCFHKFRDMFVNIGLAKILIAGAGIFATTYGFCKLFGNIKEHYVSVEKTGNVTYRHGSCPLSESLHDFESKSCTCKEDLEHDLNQFLFKEGDEVELESGKLKDKAKPKRSVRAARGLRRGRRMAPEALKLNVATHDMIMGKTSKALYNVRIPGMSEITCRAFFFSGRRCLIPRHCFEKMNAMYDLNPEFKILFQPCDGSNPTEVLFANFADSYMDIEDRDQCCIEIPSMRQHPDIRKHFISEMDALMSVKGFSATIPMSGGDGALTSMTTKVWQVRDHVTKDLDFPEVEYYSSIGFYGQVSLGKGWCGSVYWATDTSSTRALICAIHTAGSDKGECFGSAVFKEDLDLYVDTDPFTFEDSEPPIPLQPLVNEMDFSQFRVDGVCPLIPSFVKNDIVPSPLHNTFAPSTFAPARVTEEFTKEGVFVPLAYARSKVNKSVGCVSMDLLRAAQNSYIAASIPKMEESVYGRGLVPWKECIMGREGVWPGMPLKTSPGYPWSEEGRGAGKYYWFGAKGGGYDLDKPEAVEFVKFCEEQVDLMRVGLRPWWFNKDFCKVERRPSEKVLDGKTRSVNPHPMHGTAIFRRYFGAFMVSFMNAKLNIGSALGINPHGIDWTILAKLLSVNKKIIAGDYSGWDGSIMVVLMSSIIEMVEAFYGDTTSEDALIRRALMLEVTNSRHVSTVYTTKKPQSRQFGGRFHHNELVDQDGDVPDGFYKEVVIKGLLYYCYTVVYEWNGGMPSGHPVTTIGNIIINQVCLRYAMGDIILEPQGGALSYRVGQKNPFHGLEKHFYCVCFGDDNVLSLSIWLSSIVTQEKLTKSMLKIGLIYTDEDKSDRVLQHRSLDEISFLKRGFVWSDRFGRYLAPLDLNVVLEMCQWTHVKEKPGAFQQTVDMMVRELSYHPIEWKKYFPLICQAITDNRVDVYPSELSWEAAIGEAMNIDGYQY